MTERVEVRRGQVVVIDFPRAGQSRREVRPSVVVSNDVANEVAGTLTVALITAWSEPKSRLPVCVDLPAGVAGATKRSVIDCGQVHTIDKAVARPTLAHVPPALMSRVDEALRIHLDLLAD